jgi:4-diphosphocytidyl-2-C-methyl-D-erythritol kinase
LASRPAAELAPLAEFAPAKVNLTLAVLGRRQDGYHELESLVAFAALGDRLVLSPAAGMSLAVDGPGADAAGPLADNLVLKAARALAERVEGLHAGHFVLTKRLPVAAGLGGGSADAAAALRLLARLNGFSISDPRLLDAAAATGADVPVCVGSVARVMYGRGEALSDPVALAPLPAVLVNPGIAVPTRDVFAGVTRFSQTPPARFAAFSGESADAESRLLALIEDGGNDLEAPAIALEPMIAEVLAALRALDGARLVRMSGSGATCFALFGSSHAARQAARRLSAARPAWWICETVLGDGVGHDHAAAEAALQ